MAGDSRQWCSYSRLQQHVLLPQYKGDRKQRVQKSSFTARALGFGATCRRWLRQRRCGRGKVAVVVVRCLERVEAVGRVPAAVPVSGRERRLVRGPAPAGPRSLGRPVQSPVADVVALAGTVLACHRHPQACALPCRKSHFSHPPFLTRSI